MTIKQIGATVRVVEGAHTLPDDSPVQLFTGAELQALEQEPPVMLVLQMPSFIRGDEDENAHELSSLTLQTTTPA